jgi:hypothetical protein
MNNNFYYEFVSEALQVGRVYLPFADQLGEYDTRELAIRFGLN